MERDVVDATPRVAHVTPARTSIASRIGGVAACVIMAGLITAAWIVIGPTGFIFAWITQFFLMCGVAAASGAWAGQLTQRWFRVRPGERSVYRVLGVRWFGKLLDAVRWTRVVEQMRAFDGTRAGLAELDQHTRRSELGHLVCLVICTGLALAAAVLGQWGGAAWLLALGVVMHLYPMMLQRMLRGRIQRVQSAA